MADLPSPTYPRVLRRVWRLSDPSTRSLRKNNALGRETLHQRLATIRGRYWVCSETGQLERDRPPRKPDEISDLYDEWWLHEIAKGPPSRERVENQRAFLRGFENYRATGRLFEVGSGLGHVLKAAVEEGWKAEGNELSPVAARFASEFSGAPVAPGPIENVDLEREVFDVILLKNVFEHLEDPRAVLVRMATALRRGGVLYLQTLDAQSLSLLLNPTAWTHFIEGHLVVPTLVSLEHYFQAAGLRPASLETHGFSTKTGIKREKGSWLRRRADKWMATLAARLGLGHRVRAILERV